MFLPAKLRALAFTASTPNISHQRANKAVPSWSHPISPLHTPRIFAPCNRASKTAFETQVVQERNVLSFCFPRCFRLQNEKVKFIALHWTSRLRWVDRRSWLWRACRDTFSPAGDPGAMKQTIQHWLSVLLLWLTYRPDGSSATMAFQANSHSCPVFRLSACNVEGNPVDMETMRLPTRKLRAIHMHDELIHA